jgi:hypothetical protein
MHKPHGARKGTGTATVSTHVRDLSRFFNSLDPSPFWDRDLDRDAAAFIEEEFSDKRSAEVWHLNIHTQQESAMGGELQTAVENYYTRLAGSARHQLHEHLRLGQWALLAGIVILLSCMALREFLRGALQSLPKALDEGLIILAWLAMWRPAEMLAYEWVPLLSKRRLYERLAGIRILVHVGPATPRTTLR